MDDSLSPKLVAVALLFAGVLVLAGTSHLAELGPLLLGLEADSAEAAQAGLAFMVGGLGVGFSLLALGIVRGYRASQDRSAAYTPYVPVLERLAGEFGARVELDPREGVGFVTQHHGCRLEVLVQPTEPGRTRLHVEAPAKQRLMVLRSHGPDSDVDDAEWRLVGRRGRWLLRAPMPGLARPLLEDPGLVEALDDISRFEQLVGIRHDQLGVEVVAEALPPEVLRDFLRQALTVTRAFRTRNAV